MSPHDQASDPATDPSGSSAAEPSELEQARADLDAVLNGLPAMIGYWDRGLRNRMANHAYVEFFGRTPEELLGTHIRDLLGPDLFEKNRPYMERALAGEPQTFDREITTPSGEVRHTQATYIPDVAGGDVRGFFVLVTDITARRRAELALQASEERYRTLIEHLPRAAVTLVAPDLTLQYFAGQIPHEAEMDVEALIGRPIRETSGGGEHGERVEGLYARALAGETVSTELRSQRLTGRHFSLDIAPLRGADGRVTGALGVAQDTTERVQHEAEQAALAAIATGVAEGAGPAAVFRMVAREIAALFDAPLAAVTRFDADTGIGHVLGGWSADGRMTTGGTFDLAGATASAIVYRTGACARTDVPAIQATDPASTTVERFALNAGFAAPVVVGGELWGSIGMAFTDPVVPVNAEARLGRFAQLVGLAIANAEAWDTLSRQASTDSVTGIANQRTFHERLQAEVQRAQRYGRDLSMVLLDLDHFKAVNDRFGHQVGDRVLAEVARRLEAQSRNGELVARVGGEEFAWLMPETSQQDAYRAAERMRQVLESEPVATVGTVTLSAGVSSCEHGRDPEDLVRYADRALYWAKDSGRNTIFVYTPEAHRLLAEQERIADSQQVLSSVRSLARAIDAKDWSTREHSERVADLAEQLALKRGWTTRRARMLHVCGLLHDVGKIGIPDSILLKPGSLTHDEQEEVKVHSALSAQIAAEVLEHDQVVWIRGHHERWDGTGYPDGLSGDAIPEGAQLLALADAWDVMTESRAYKEPKGPGEALEECRRERGRQFAPAAVDALVALVTAAAQARASGPPD